MQRRTLNDHLFDALDRLSNADDENIDVEMNKAHSIVHVSEKILDAAKFKLQVIQTDAELLNIFDEIDNPFAPRIENNSSKKEVEYFDVDKEKNWLNKDHGDVTDNPQEYDPLK